MESRPTVAEIDLAALRHNYRQVQKVLPPSCGTLAVVKADAYGHGFMDISLQLEALGVTAFGVAFLAEGIQLRKAGIDRPILVLGGIYPGQERKCVGFNLSTAVFSIEQARALDEAAQKLYRKASIHVKIDTGMGRLGIPHAASAEFFADLARLPNLEVEGIFSHFASADELDERGQAFTDLQAERFRAAVHEAVAAGFRPRYIHVANSAAAFALKLPFCTLVRPGIVLYGSVPSADFHQKMDLRPVMSLRSRIAMLKLVEPGGNVSYARRFTADRPTLVASVPVGYADGYVRSLTNKGEALIRGARARVIGTVCMDWVMLDVTDIPGVAVGDQVTLLGSDGSEGWVHTEELAEKAGTIPYEIFCGISKRVPRIYIGHE